MCIADNTTEPMACIAFVKLNDLRGMAALIGEAFARFMQPRRIPTP